MANPDGLVFHSERGTPLNPENVRNRVLHPAIKAFQAQLGHTDSRLTLSVYTQPMPEAQRQLAKKISGVLLPIAAKSETGENEADEKPVVIQ